MGAPCTVAVIGLGYFSQFHLMAWRDHPGAELIGATDLSADRRVWAADAYGIPVAQDVQALLADDPGIIDIVAPPPAHAGLIHACLKAGRTIICQKPFCTSLAEAQAVTEAAERAGTRLLIHENFRFQPWYRTIKNVLDDGMLGPVWRARFALRPGDGRGADAYLDRQPAFQTMPRLLVHETAVHFIDLFRWLLGDITAIYADLRRLNPAIAGEDAGILLMDHAGGAQSTFDGNRLSDHATDNPRRTMGEMEIEGAGGTLRLDGMGRVSFRAFGGAAARDIPLIAPMDDTFGGGCVAALCGHVIAALQGAAPFENEARDYLDVIAATDLAYASAETGRKMSTR